MSFVRSGGSPLLQAQGGEVEGGAPLPRQRARALERIGAVVVRAGKHFLAVAVEKGVRGALALGAARSV